MCGIGASKRDFKQTDVKSNSSIVGLGRNWFSAQRDGRTASGTRRGCSRLDSRLENGRNWAFAEGGAGRWADDGTHFLGSVSAAAVSFYFSVQGLGLI